MDSFDLSCFVHDDARRDTGTRHSFFFSLDEHSQQRIDRFFLLVAFSCFLRLCYIEMIQPRDVQKQGSRFNGASRGVGKPPSQSGARQPKTIFSSCVAPSLAHLKHTVIHRQFRGIHCNRTEHK